MRQPLDPQKAYFYGRFVQAAYEMFLHPQGGDPLRPDPAGIPDGYELGAWIHMSDFILTAKKPEFYGIVVHGQEGKNDPDWRIIAIRGTEGALEWIDDALAIPVRFRQVPSAGRVACGFDRIYSSLKVVKRRLAGEPAAAAPGAATEEAFGGSFADQLEQLAIAHEAARGVAARVGEPRRPRPTVVAGHSLGSALTTLFVMENARKHKFDIQTLCTFASPRVGNKEFARAFDQLPINSWRVVNTIDVVPKLPLHLPVPLDYDHVEMAYPFTSADFTGKSLVCRHCMETYLHWLNSKSTLREGCGL
jgi:hypothetical protein